MSPPPICGQMVEAMAHVAGLTHAWLGRWGRGGGREGVQGRWRGQVWKEAKAGSQGRNRRGRQVWQMTTEEGHSVISLRKLPVTATGMILSN